jgi:organic radical activating enzyme
MGGYGYWNFNGTLRSFSNDHKSWDCADLTWPKEEIVLKSTNCLLQSDYNDNKGIFLANVCKRCNKSNEFINTNECYLIGPKSSEVAYIGTINDELSDTYYICQSIGGIIAEGNNHFYFIDFSKNEFYILNSDLSKLLYQYTRAKSPMETYYIDKNVLKIFNTQTKQWKTKQIYEFIQENKENEYKTYCEQNNTVQPTWEEDWITFVLSVKGKSYQDSERIIRSFVENLRRIRHHTLCAKDTVERDDREQWPAITVVKAFLEGKLDKFKAYTETRAGEKSEDPTWIKRWSTFVESLEQNRDDAHALKSTCSKFMAAQRIKKYRASKNMVDPSQKH